jgi:SNF2 family DNA or RNA helicase
MKTKPLPHQKKVLQKIKNKDNIALFMDYGTGKSWCLLAWIEYHKFKSTLIVCNKTNIMEGDAWTEQIRQHSNFSYEILLGTKDSKIKKLFAKPHKDLYLINYESLASLKTFLKDRNFDCIIFDESTAIKNPRAKVTKTAIWLSKYVDNTAISTGFPVSENLQEIWSQYHVVDKNNILESTYWKFLNKYFHRWRFGWIINKGADKKIVSQIEHNSVFLSLEQCMKLSPRLHKYYPLSVKPEQKKYLKELKEDFALEISSCEKLEFKHVLPVIAKMQQICSGFFYLEDRAVVFDTPKSEILLDIVERTHNRKKIIWCKYIYEMNFLKNLLKKYKPLILCNTLDKSKILEEFKNGDSDILIASYGILHSGETLVVSDCNIHYSYTWSNSIFTNAQRRTHRIGQSKKVIYIYLFIKNTIEEEILKALKKKKGIQNRLKGYMKKWVEL